MTSAGKNKEWKHSTKTFLIELLLGIIVGGGWKDKLDRKGGHRNAADHHHFDHHARGPMVRCQRNGADSLKIVKLR